MFRLDGEVALITGSSRGIGRAIAERMAEAGAKVVVSGRNAEPCQEVVDAITAAGGEAIANGANVANMVEVEAMVAQALDKWGRVDILVNNAGILRDKSFAKMEMTDFQLVVDVHLMGSANCAKAVWALMREQGYGRIVMTTSSSGMYGNFGQANYGAAKMAVVGLMNTLFIEGEKYNVKVNCLSPTAGTRMLEGLVSEEQSDIMTVEAVTAGLLTLCDEAAPNRSILCAGAGGYARTHIYETDGIYLPPEQQTPENVRAQIDAIDNPEGQEVLVGGFQQTNKFVAKAAAYMAEK